MLALPGRGGSLPAQEVACHPYKLLACSRAGQGALLGLVDDVDCAVVEATAPDGLSPACLRHLSSIPALSYVAEGKHLHAPARQPRNFVAHSRSS